MKVFRFFTVYCAILFILLHTVQGAWFRGATHTHTTVNGGDTDPDGVAQWYYDHGFDFLCITDHNAFTDPATVSDPAGSSGDFILVPSEEITGNKAIHTSALGIQGFVGAEVFNFNADNQSEIVAAHQQGAIAMGGFTILNHPSWSSGIIFEQMYDSDAITMFEVFNGATYFDEPDQLSATEKWDSLLTRGRTIYGVASDDAHVYTEFTTPLSNNPGRGWVMVQADELEVNAITTAMQAGDFYASHGVMLKTVNLDRNTWKLTIEVDEEATAAVLDPAVTPYIVPWIHENRPSKVIDSSLGYEIQFIGPGAEVLHNISGPSAEYQVTNLYAYVRARVIYQIEREGETQLYNAWTQPVFTDARDGQDTSGLGQASLAVFGPNQRVNNQNLQVKQHQNKLYLQIPFLHKSRHIHIQLMDVKGKIIYNRKKRLQQDTPTRVVYLDLTKNGDGLARTSGLVFVKINTGSQVLTGKVFLNP